MKTLFIAANRMIRINPSNPDGWPDADNQEVLPVAHAAAMRYKNEGYRIVAIENQGGVPKYKTAEQMHIEFLALMMKAWWIDDLFICCDYHTPRLEEPGKSLEAGIYAYHYHRPAGGVPELHLLRNELLISMLPVSPRPVEGKSDNYIPVWECDEGFRKPGSGLFKVALALTPPYSKAGVKAILPDGAVGKAKAVYLFTEDRLPPDMLEIKTIAASDWYREGE